MSTHCIIEFRAGENDRAAAAVYQHHDGYPEGERGMLAKLMAFLDEADYRGDDPMYVAARYLVWAAARAAASAGAPLEPARLMGYGITVPEGLAYGAAVDVPYVYLVTCRSTLRAVSWWPTTAPAGAAR